MAVDECQILGKPRQILTLQGRIDDGHILAVPESILGIQIRIPNLQVFHILERVLTFHLHMVKGNIPAVKEQIFCRDRGILQRNTTAFPPNS